ncbi:hypothetical protein ACLOJK_003011 [Asimina triloba]
MRRLICYSQSNPDGFPSFNLEWMDAVIVLLGHRGALLLPAILLSPIRPSWVSAIRFGAECYYCQKTPSMLLLPEDVIDVATAGEMYSDAEGGSGCDFFLAGGMSALTEERTVKESDMHFVLVHGAGHGAWCWYKLAALLRSDGHKVTAADMASSGVDLRPLDQVPSLDSYFQPLMEIMASLDRDDRVILVGHSYGGIGISLAMERYPNKILVAVFASALMPNLDGPISQVMKEVHEITYNLMYCIFIFMSNAGHSTSSLCSSYPDLPVSVLGLVCIVH